MAVNMYLYRHLLTKHLTINIIYYYNRKKYGVVANELLPIHKVFIFCCRI